MNIYYHYLSTISAVQNEGVEKGKRPVRLASEDKKCVEPPALGSAAADWIHVGRSILLKRRPEGNPLSVLAWRHSEDLPPPMERIVVAFYRLPRLVECPPPNGEARFGPWCAAAPLWGNPLVEAYQLGRDQPHPSLMELLFPGLVSDGMHIEPQVSATLAVLETEFAANRDAAAAAQILTNPFVVATLGTSLMRLAFYRAAQQKLPAAWLEASRAASAQGGPGVPPEPEAIAAVARRLGWQWGSTVRRLEKYTVKQGTKWLQSQSPGYARQQELLSAFSTMAGPPQHECMAIVPRLQAMWRIPWHNKNKEVYWLLALNGLPTAERMATVERCACGAEGSHGRLHYFFDCPVAQHLIHELQAALDSPSPVRPADLLHASWPPSCHAGVGQVVTLAATDALWHAVRRGRKAQMPSRGGEPAETAGATLAARMGRLAVAHFWDRLADFCALQLAPVAWRAECTGGGRFLHWLPQEETWVVLRRPP